MAKTTPERVRVTDDDLIRRAKAVQIVRGNATLTGTVADLLRERMAQLEMPQPAFTYDPPAVDDDDTDDDAGESAA